MNNAKAFERGLDSLFRRYTEKLRRTAGKLSRGPLPKVDRNRVEKAIEHLVTIASTAELRSKGCDTFENIISEKRQWHPKRGKGWGLDAKKRAFQSWYGSNINARNCVYIFWAERKCMYVGRTGASGCRPQAHFEKYWFSNVTRIDTYIVENNRYLPMAECIAIHRFRPMKNKVKSAQQKWRSSCPVCAKEVQVRKQLKQLFPLRRKRK